MVSGAEELLLDALLEDGAMELLDFGDLDDALTPTPVVVTPVEEQAKLPVEEETLEDGMRLHLGSQVQAIPVVAKPEPLDDLEESAMKQQSSEDDEEKVVLLNGAVESKESKKQRRLIRNRMSAQLHRERKKAYVDHLEALVKTRDDEILSLKDEMVRLRAENSELRSVSIVTPSDCSVISVDQVGSGYTSAASSSSAVDDDSSVDGEVKPQVVKRQRVSGPVATLALAAMSCVAVMTSTPSRRTNMVHQPSSSLEMVPAAAVSRSSRRKLLALSDREAEWPLMYSKPEARSVELFRVAHNATYEVVTQKTLRGSRGPRRKEQEAPLVNESSYLICSQAAGVLARPSTTTARRSTTTTARSTEDSSSAALVPSTYGALPSPQQEEDEDPLLLDNNNNFMHIVVPANDMDFSAWSDYYQPQQQMDPPKWVEIGCNMAYARLRFS